MAKALVVAETFAGKTTAVKVSPSTTPASRRVFSKSKHSPLDDKSPWCHTIKIFIPKNPWDVMGCQKHLF